MKYFRYLACCYFLFAALCSKGQATFNMANQTVDLCEGILLDSDANIVNAGDYAHNENFTFTICPPGAASITLTFSSFCTELGYDSLRFFDGPDTNSPLINGVGYSGFIPPPPIVSTGCLTINFVSDANIACTGWEANWTTDIEEPVPPNILINPVAPTCSTEVVTLTFDQMIPCDSIVAGAFSISGPIGQGANPVPINCVNDSTNQVELNMSPGLDESGTYTIQFTTFFLDPCDSVWELTAEQTMDVLDCPLQLEVLAVDTLICPGTCTQIYADVSGGNPATYQYAWSGGLPNSPGPHTVCPAVPTTYSVTVSDASPAASVMGSVFIDFLPPPTVPNDTTVCQREPWFFLNASPPGGYWNGNGILDTITGRFNPSSAGPGNHFIKYYAPNGCVDSLEIEVLPGYAGSDEAACPGAGAFVVSGQSPLGGTWSGPFIQGNGTFDPVASGPGSFDVVYTYTNGCTDIKTVNVDNISVQPDDTVCQSTPEFYLSFTPYGGNWAGVGIQTTKSGRFDPADAGVGTHELVYTMQGCTDTVNITVQAISAGPDRTACPTQAPVNLPAGNPPGGTWSGIGVINPNTGLFDPGTQGGNYNDSVVYTFDGCTDTMVIYVRYTQILGNLTYGDTVPFCPVDSNFQLNWANVRRTPSGGTWAGTGVTNPNTGIFNPLVAGPGYHTLTYTLNTCSDDIVMFVHPYATITDTQVCINTSPFELHADPSGGIWKGNGITDTLLGTFSPQVAGPDTHFIQYTSPFGCIDTSPGLIVTEMPILSISNLENVYCLKDTLVNVVVDPPGGVLSGAGIVGLTFNPTLAGAGQHKITYTHGVGDCEQTVDHFLNITPALDGTIEVTLDRICAGEFTQITAIASGGIGANYNFSWSHGLGNSFQQLIQPSATTTFTVTIGDGCTDPITRMVTIIVEDTFALDIVTSPIKCFGQPGFAKVNVIGNSNYSFEWNTKPPHRTDSLSAPVSKSYTVVVKDDQTGCFEEREIKIPGHPRVEARFTTNPAECATNIDPTIEFIDRSVGSHTGIWRWGDGTTEDYQLYYNPTHTYIDTGKYIVSLEVRNQGGCRDTVEQEICVKADFRFFVPNAFTPDGDGLNDLFRVLGPGIDDFEISIFNRWGEVIYYSKDISEGWDGTFRGKSVPQGVYVYNITYRPITYNTSSFEKVRGIITVVY